MKVYLGADHRGFNLKEHLKDFLGEEHEILDMGNDRFDPQDDYPDFAAKVAEKVSQDPEARGIVLCGSGAGVDIVANKFDGVRSVLASFPEEALAARKEDDVNVLAIPADFVDENVVQEIVTAFLTSEFTGEERRKRRLKKIADIEEEN